jgi:hypothetical protein
MLLLAALVVVSAATSAQGPSPPAINGVFDVAAFGAAGDGKTDDHAAIQRAIDAAMQAGGGEVVLPARGPYRLTAPLVACAQNPDRSWEDSFPPSSVHFKSFTGFRISSPAHAILRADASSGHWPPFASPNVTSAMLLIGVQVDGQGCTSTPLYATVENLQFEGAAAWTPAGWGGASLALRAPAYPLVAPKAAIAISWAYRLTLRANSITGVTVGIYAKGADNLKLESNVIRANHAIIAEDCGDSTFEMNDLYPFGWGVILRGWSGDSLLLRNVVTGMPLIDPGAPACANAKVAWPQQPTRQCDAPMRLPASGGILLDNAAESCGWENSSAVFANLWPFCKGRDNPQNLLTGNAIALTVHASQFHGVRAVLSLTGKDPHALRQLTFSDNNLMDPLGEALGFVQQQQGPGCNFSFPCDSCVCSNNVNTQG